MIKPELLAPAGNMDSLHAAVMAGCDAVYLGGKMFGARSFASNFDKDELVNAVNYAHLYGVKVYVTVNTLIYDHEVENLLDYVKYLHKIGVDAVIMQDIGMINLIRQVLPNMDVHASTQLHIHNLDGAKLVESMGLTRTVLARETSIDEIKFIKENTNIELEIFVHGALCISYSGQCLMSSLIGGRSGNRGACAGSCRLQYDLVDSNGNKVNKDKYLLSTKDLNSLDHIGELIDIGVDSFKIEGRMKRPEYVFLVVSLYRKAIDSYMKNGHVNILEQDINELKKIFNREFTKGFLFNEDNDNIVNQFRPNHMGVKIGTVVNYRNNMVTVKLLSSVRSGDGIRIVGDKDTGLTLTTFYINHNRVTCASQNDVICFKVDEPVKVNSNVVKTTDLDQLTILDKLIKETDRRVNITGLIKLKINNLITLSLSDGKNNATVSFGNVYEAKHAPISELDILKQISKLGSTVYNLTNLDIESDDNIFVSIKDLNEIRRMATRILDTKRLTIKQYKECQYSMDVPDFKRKSNLNIKVLDIDMYNKIKNGNYKYIYVDEMNLYNLIKADDRVIYLTPRVIEQYPSFDRLVQIEEFGGIRQYKNYMTGAFFNVTNSYTLAFLHHLGSKKVTLSYELTYDGVVELINSYIDRYHKYPNVEVIVYGNEEAMISKFNLLKKFNVTGNYYLKDRFNNSYPIRIRDNKMIIYNYRPRLFDENYFSIGVNNIRYDILNKEELKEVELITKK